MHPLICALLLLLSCRLAAQSKPKDTIACPLEHGEARQFFTRTDIPVDFDGGYFKWIRFGQQNFDFHYLLNHLPDTTQEFHDSITLKFGVTRDGILCSLHQVSGNPLLWVPAMRLIRHAHWIPGSSDGRLLNCWRTLRIAISMDRRKGTFVFGKNPKNYDLPNAPLPGPTPE